MTFTPKKPQSSAGSNIAITIVVFSFIAIVSVIVYQLLKEEPIPIPKVGKISETEYNNWQSICEEILESDIGLAPKKFLPNFLDFCRGKKEKIIPFCKKHNYSVEKFLYICRSLGEARNNYITHERETSLQRSVFPVDLLPEGFESENIPETEVYTQEDLKKMSSARPILAHNLKLYIDEIDNINSTIENLCTSENLDEELEKELLEEEKNLREKDLKKENEDLEEDPEYSDEE